MAMAFVYVSEILPTRGSSFPPPRCPPFGERCSRLKSFVFGVCRFMRTGVIETLSWAWWDTRRGALGGGWLDTDGMQDLDCTW